MNPRVLNFSPACCSTSRFWVADHSEEVYRMTQRTLNTTRSKIPMYALLVSASPFNPFSVEIWSCWEIRKCTKWPQNDVAPLTVERVLYTLNFLRVPQDASVFFFARFGLRKRKESQKMKNVKLLKTKRKQSGEIMDTCRYFSAICDFNPLYSLTVALLCSNTEQS